MPEFHQTARSLWESLPVVLILIGGGLIITVACDFVQIMLLAL